MSELEWTESRLWVSIAQEESHTDSLTSTLLWQSDSSSDTFGCILVAPQVDPLLSFSQTALHAVSSELGLCLFCKYFNFNCWASFWYNASIPVVIHFFEKETSSRKELRVLLRLGPGLRWRHFLRTTSEEVLGS